TFLVVERNSLPEEVQAPSGETLENTGETDNLKDSEETSGIEAEKAPGFGLVSALIIFSTGGKLAAGRWEYKTRK
ncbi:MAG: hypothetical protein QG610_129, partial [Euryarchaeota archaeon]|nr:hypothetical protein [Euryarchaeota archaeon]